MTSGAIYSLSDETLHWGLCVLAWRRFYLYSSSTLSLLFFIGLLAWGLHHNSTVHVPSANVIIFTLMDQIQKPMQLAIEVLKRTLWTVIQIIQKSVNGNLWGWVRSYGLKLLHFRVWCKGSKAKSMARGRKCLNDKGTEVKFTCYFIFVWFYW